MLIRQKRQTLATLLLNSDCPMRITDIVNKGVRTITRCENEPIHIPGSIQPYGALIAADSEKGVISYCSANIAEYLGLSPEQLLEKPISLLPALAPSFAARNPAQPLTITVGNQPLLVTTDAQPDQIILSLEKQTSPENPGLHLFEQTQSFVEAIDRVHSLIDLCRHIATATRRITGYDRVMIYRFDKAYNGEIIAESREDHLEPFLGLHYPHTDIPPQARELYLRMPLRMIPDVYYTPQPVLTTAPYADTQLDMSNVELRSVSPIHIQYLKNMGVAATLAISVIMEGRLWGMIVCHHQTPRLISPEQRKAALMQGYFLSSQIRVREVAAEYEVSVTVDAHLQQLLNHVGSDDDFPLKFERLTSLLAVTNATGVVVLNNGEFYQKGLVPPREQLLSLIHWVDEHAPSGHYSTNMLSKRYPKAAEISKYASGMIFHALGKASESCIIWFREEVERTIRWAGRPDLAMTPAEPSQPLTPRKSFEIWKELVKLQSVEWRASELNAAVRFATALQSNIHLNYLREEDARLRILNNKLEEANKELANINWITSHDLKEPLRKIQVFASRIVDRENHELSDALLTQIGKIQKSAQRMYRLVDDIISYSMTSNRRNMVAVSDLSTIMAEVTEECRDELRARQATLNVRNLPAAIAVVPHQINQLFTNLLSNALKFSRTDIPPVININCSVQQGANIKDAVLPADQSYYRITMEDNGIGFEPAYNEKIFGIFSRLHTADAYRGTGMGLAICKKIVEQHHGAITAAGKLGIGSVFTVYLPVE